MKLFTNLITSFIYYVCYDMYKQKEQGFRPLLLVLVFY